MSFLKKLFGGIQSEQKSILSKSPITSEASITTSELKDESPKMKFDISDYAKYLSVKIGNQIWMTENLNIDVFQNGDPIPEAKTKEEWKYAGDDTKPAWCYYDNDPENGKKYGKLYNWYAVNDPRGLAPEGWHIPSDLEWTDLVIFLICERNNLKYTSWSFDSVLDNEVGIVMKKDGWEYGVGWNDSGFSGLPGGMRFGRSEFDSDFALIGREGVWWSSSVENKEEAWAFTLMSGSNSLSRIPQTKNNGFSVRCSHFNFFDI